VKALAAISVEANAIVIPAGVRQTATMARPSLKDEVPLLAAALPWVGHLQTRSRGTICGSVAHADPSAEIPLCLVALEGEVRLRARRKTRRIPAEAFFTGMMATDKGDNEWIEAVAFPKRRPGTGSAFAEVARRHGDFAIVACAAVVDAQRMRLAVAGVADRPTARDLPIVEGALYADLEIHGALGQHVLRRAVGRIELRGTAWSARNAASLLLPRGVRCRVVSVDGLTLLVEAEGAR